MAFLTKDCPQCGATAVGMPVYGVLSAMRQMYNNNQKKWFGFGAVYCGKCLTPFGVKVTPKTPDRVIDAQETLLKEAFKHTADVSHFDLNWELSVVQADPPTLDHLPPNIERALRQADSNLERDGCEEPAAVFFGRAIELALKHAHPEVTGTLAQRISRLAADRVIPQSMSDWANQVRIVRNDGAHDDGVTREDALAARNFADAFLRYLITMPAMVEARRRALQPPQEPETAS